MKNNIILFVFIFINLYNPYSVYLTFALNIAFILFTSVQANSEIRFNNTILILTFFILLWALFMMTIHSSFNIYVWGKYFRALISTISIMVVCSQMRVSLTKLIEILSYVLLSHIVAIIIQIIFPSVRIPMAIFFGFERETTIITSLLTRKLGLSSSYDTASLFSVSTMIFFLLLYSARKKRIYIFFSLLSFFASLQSSRVGMLIAITFLLLYFIGLSFNTDGKQRFLYVLLLLFSTAVLFIVILPIISSTSNLFFYESNYNFSFISESDYTTGTAKALLFGGSHWDPLFFEFFDLIFGFGKDPTSSFGGRTDIGYVKIIYHVGIIGLIIVCLIYFYIFNKARKIRKNSIKNSDEYIMATFILIFIIVLLFFNFKSLEMYSRGNHDLLLIVFAFLLKEYNSKKIIIQ